MKQQLKDLAKEMFAAHKDEVFLVTSDNQFFPIGNPTIPKAHQEALNTASGKNEEVLRITPADLEKPSDEEIQKEKDDAEKVPTEKSTAKQIADYLTAKGVEFDATLKKADLVVKLNEYLASLTPPTPQE